MRKIFILSLLFMLILAGCGAGATKTMSCTYDDSNNVYDTKMTYNIDHQGDEVKKIRIMYNYKMNSANNENGIDGVGTGTDGTTNDSILDNDGIVDGVIGSAIDTIINGATDIILDVSGLKDRHNVVLNTYGNIPGFSVQNTNDMTNDNYNVTYIIDYDTISDTDLNSLNLSRNINTLRDNFISQGFTCK